MYQINTDDQSILDITAILWYELKKEKVNESLFNN